MKTLFRFLCALALSLGVLSVPAHAADADPLFINLTVDEPARAGMALTLGLHQQENGHPLTVYLSDRAVLLSAKAPSEQPAAAQKMLLDLMRKGAVILVCPPCMKHHGLTEADLLPGLQVSNRELLGQALFRGNTRALSW